MYKGRVIMWADKEMESIFYTFDEVLKRVNDLNISGSAQPIVEFGALMNRLEGKLLDYNEKNKGPKDG